MGQAINAVFITLFVLFVLAVSCFLSVIVVSMVYTGIHFGIFVFCVTCAFFAVLLPSLLFNTLDDNDQLVFLGKTINF